MEVVVIRKKFKKSLPLLEGGRDTEIVGARKDFKNGAGTCMISHKSGTGEVPYGKRMHS